MTMMREHKLFHVQLEMDRRDRREDSMGELVGYSDTYRTVTVVHVVAPSQLVAEAWALDRNNHNNPKVKECSFTPIDGFVQDHIY